MLLNKILFSLAVRGGRSNKKGIGQITLISGNVFRLLSCNTFTTETFVSLKFAIYFREF